MTDTANPLDSKPIVSFVIATYNRRGDLEEAIASVLDQQYRPIEIVVVSNSTETEAEATLFESGGRFDGEPVRYLHYPERMGVPKARNIGYEHADGEFLVTLDDDAILADPGATERLLSLFNDHDDVAAVAFQSRSYYTHEPLLNEIPSPPDFELPPTERMRVSTFCGVGNALRQEAVLDVGAFADDFVYGFEEQDLSIRLLDEGYDILYAPSVVVFHKKSSKGRLPEIETRINRIENRMRIAIRNLPWRYVLLTVLLWSVYGLVSSRLHPGPLVRVYRRLYAQRETLLSERTVVNGDTIALLKARSTLLFGWWYGPHPRRFLVNPDRLRW